MKTFTFIVALFSASTLAGAQTRPATTGDGKAKSVAAPPAKAGTAKQRLTVEAIVAHVNAANDALQSWSATFAERRHFVHFDYSETRSGTILFARDRGLRLDIDKPSSEVAIVTRTEARLWDPKTNQLHIYRLDQELPADRLPIPIFIGRSGWAPAKDNKLAVLESNDPEVVLEMTPFDAGSTYQRQTIWLDPETWLPVRVQLVERTDDVVHFVFSDAQRNAKVEDRRFKLDTPADAEVMEHTDLPKF